jgi:hypothetical protein
MRQRQSSEKQHDDDTADDDTALPPDALETLDSKQQQHEVAQRQGSLLVLQRTSSITGSGSSFSERLQPWHIPRNSLQTTAAAAAASSRAHSWADAAGTIPEDLPADYADTSSRERSRLQRSMTAADQDWLADDGDAGVDEDARFSHALSRLQSRSMLRLESFSVTGRCAAGSC